MTPRQTITDIRKHGARMRGQGELIAHLRGEELTLQERIWAAGYDCHGWGVDFKRDKIPCDLTLCPLYPACQFGGQHTPGDTRITPHTSSENEVEGLGRSGQTLEESRTRKYENVKSEGGSA
ncbi:MAG: hypothetical protein QME27_01060 [Syntrophaceae bacterium]|nr:hypothetical protein [Syntrophaceae bacterium]